MSTAAACIVLTRRGGQGTYAHVNTHAYAHVHTRVYSSIYAHVYTHVYTRFCTHVCTHVFGHICAQVRTHVYTHVCTHTCLRTCLCTCLYTCLCTGLYTCRCTCLCTDPYTRLNTSTHMAPTSRGGSVVPRRQSYQLGAADLRRQRLGSTFELLLAQKIENKNEFQGHHSAAVVQLWAASARLGLSMIRTPRISRQPPGAPT